ncbi:glycosyltransferase family 2 protein [Robiginitalea sp. IMCC43444]|uniref:glycosyltransferase family 2 protein n=1 Tax=Robiginitalea sp. IMCC43444 TaxID=3459121 RepID=UPI00404263CF
MMKPEVSIITPVFNAEKHIIKCLESVLNQSFENFEHILIDDYSTDRSGAIINEKAAKDDRIRYIRMAQNAGPAVSRNKGIESARGRFIAFLDSDDIWHPEKLTRQISYMKENEYHFTFTSYNTMNEEGIKLDRVMEAASKVTYKKALYKNPIGCLTAIYDTQFFGKQYMPEIRKRQDFALWLKLLKKTDAYGLQEVLATYRIQSNSVSSNKLGLIKYEWRIYRNIEGFGYFKSAYFLISAIFIKLKSYL